MKKFLLFSPAVLLIAFVSLQTFKSTKAGYKPTGNLQGVITDALTKEGLPFATLKLFDAKGIMVTGATSDLDGFYGIKLIDSGTYSLEVSSPGYVSDTIRNISLTADKIMVQDIAMRKGVQDSSNVILSGKANIQADEIATYQWSSNAERSSRSDGFYKTNNGQAINTNGNRNGSPKYYVDGIPMKGSAGLTTTSPNGAVSAKYENTTEEKKDKEILKKPMQAQYAPPAPAYSDAEYAPLIENEYKSVKSDPLSTFSIDVDDASYANFRRFINAGTLPPKDAIRIEEFINFFHYDYPQPTDEHPFSVSMEQAVCPWNTAHTIVGIGIKGKTIDYDKLPPSNLVFLIDVSGSMEPQERLPLLKNCFKLLIKNLRPMDRVAIVTYAGNAGLALPSTSGKNKDAMYKAIDQLEAGGSTAGGQGIELAYKIAKENFIKDGNNRVILATDGDFNVGISSETDLQQLIESKRGDGIFLTTLGVGDDNYKDAKMELLADKGNGNYSYLDTYEQGRKVFGEQLTSTLFTIAKDVKLQIEFNPALAKGYRLIGYEDRMLNKEDFNNDKKDAGDLGIGHTVTAFYEIIPAGSPEILNSVDDLKYQQVTTGPAMLTNELLTLKMRYKQPDGDVSKLLVRTLKNMALPINNCSENFRFATAAAEFAMLLRQSKFCGTATFKQAIDLAKASKGIDEDGLKTEFLKLAATAEELSDNSQARK